MALPLLKLQQSLRHDMANTVFYRMALYVLNARLTLSRIGTSRHTPQTLTTFQQYDARSQLIIPAFPNDLAAKGFQNGTLARGCNGVKWTVFRIHNTRFLARTYVCVWPLPTVVMTLDIWQCAIADHFKQNSIGSFSSLQ